MKYAFAGNRDISVKILEFMVKEGFFPSALLLTDKNDIEAKKIIELSQLKSNNIYFGNPNKIFNLIHDLEKLDLDYIIGIHYPYIIKENLLNLPKKAFLNLHPAFLPYNRGWHTPSWAILEKTPIGATIHEMSDKLDMGDIIHQKEITINPEDTADSLYKRLKRLEFEVYKEIFPKLVKKSYKKIKQNPKSGTSHKKNDLFKEEILKLDLNNNYKLENLLDKLRALTTNQISEAAYFVKDGIKYIVQNIN